MLKMTTLYTRVVYTVKGFWHQSEKLVAAAPLTPGRQNSFYFAPLPRQQKAPRGGGAFPVAQRTTICWFSHPHCSTAILSAPAPRPPAPGTAPSTSGRVQRR